jgi:hypothetical protein
MINNYDVIDTMQKYGGSFAKAIAEAFRRADSENFKRLQDAFPELWEQYAQMSITIKNQQAKDNQ